MSMICVSKEYEIKTRVETKFFYIYVYIYIYIYIKELSQQVFIYNKEVPYASHTSCAKVAILLPQDLSTVCATDIYGIYFHLSVQCS